MSRPRTDCAKRHLVREKRRRERLREETPGTADCGRASRARYVQGCRCGACRAASAAYERDRTRGMAYGRPSGLVDAEPVRRRVRELKAAGYTHAELERLAADDYHPGKRQPRYEVLKLGVSWDRETLKQRIDERLERRLRDGMVQEVQGLLDAGVSREFLMKLGLEYRYLTRYLDGELTYEQMVLELGNAIKKFAKRQVTWFKKDPAIHWLDMRADPAAQAAALIDRFLDGDGDGNGER